MGWYRRLRDAFHSAKTRDTFDEESRFHLDRLTEHNLRQGMDDEPAQREARRRFGNTVGRGDRVEDVDTLSWARDLVRDCQHAWRGFRRAPGVALAALAALVLGIGLTTAVFVFVDDVLLRPLPYDHADRLVHILHNRPDKSHATLVKFTYLVALQRRHPAFDYVAGYDSYSNLGAKQLEAVASPGGGNVALAATRVSPDLFPLLGVRAEVGRTFSDQESNASQNRVALLSDGAWREYFGGSETVLGQAVVIDGRPYVVIGIMPPSFSFPDRATQCWIPLTPHEVPPPSAPRSDSPDSAVLDIVARLREGTPLEAATAETEALYRSVDRELRADYSTIKQRVEIEPLQDELTARVRPALRLMPFAVLILLVIACVNVANILLVRGTSQAREIAIRTSLGADRWRLARQMIAESITLSTLGAVGGAALAAITLRMIAAFAPADMPRIEELRVGVAVFLTTTAVAVTAAFLSGIVPALRLASADYSELLKFGSSRATLRATSASGSRSGQTLLILQVALTMSLLIVAGLLLRSAVNMSRVRPGYDAERVLAFQVALPAGADNSAFYSSLLERLESNSRIRFAGTADKLPILGVGGLYLSLEGLPIPVADDRLVMRVVSHDYLRAMGTRVMRGRGLEESDVAGAPAVLLINEALARRHFGQQDPLGSAVVLAGHRFRVVGIVEDMRHGGLDAPPDSEYFVDVRQSPVGSGGRPYVVVRVEGNPADVTTDVRRLVQQVDPSAYVDLDMTTMRELQSSYLARPRFYAALVILFATVATALATIGVFSIVTFLVARRTAEIGVRIAVGASPADVLILVFRDGGLSVLAGIILGSGLGLGVTRFVRSMLFGVTPSDPATFGSVGLLFAIIATIAIYLPARRALRIDPLLALKME